MRAAARAASSSRRCVPGVRRLQQGVEVVVAGVRDASRRRRPGDERGRRRRRQAHRASAYRGRRCSALDAAEDDRQDGHERKQDAERLETEVDEAVHEHREQPRDAARPRSGPGGRGARSARRPAPTAATSSANSTQPAVDQQLERLVLDEREAQREWRLQRAVDGEHAIERAAADAQRVGAEDGAARRATAESGRSVRHRAGLEAIDELAGAERARARARRRRSTNAPSASADAPAAGARLVASEVAQEREHQRPPSPARATAPRDSVASAPPAHSSAPTSQPTRLSARRRWNEQARQTKSASSRNSAVWLLLTNGPMSSDRAVELEHPVELGQPEDPMAEADDDGGDAREPDRARQHVAPASARRQVVGDDEDRERRRGAPDVDARVGGIEAERPGGERARARCRAAASVPLRIEELAQRPAAAGSTAGAERSGTPAGQDREPSLSAARRCSCEARHRAPPARQRGDHEHQEHRRAVDGAGHERRRDHDRDRRRRARATRARRRRQRRRAPIASGAGGAWTRAAMS